MSCLPAAACLLLFTGSVLLYHLSGPQRLLVAGMLFAFSDKRERERWLQEVRFQPESGDPWPDISFLYNLTVPLGNRVGRAGCWKKKGVQKRGQEEAGRPPGLPNPGIAPPPHAPADNTAVTLPSAL